MNPTLICLYGDVLTRSIGSGPGLCDAVGSIIDRTVAWIDHDRQRKIGSAPPLVTQDMMKQSPQTPAYSNLPAKSTPTLSGTASSTGTPISGIPPSRNGYYGESGPDPATAYPPIPYNDASGHTSDTIPYDSDKQYLYAQAAGQVAAAHAQAQTQGQVVSHNPLSNFAAQATQMTQPEMMWRQEASGWHDWTAAVVDNQDRYSANALMSLGAGNRSVGVVNDGNTGGSDMSIGVGMNGATVPTTANMQWPLLLFHDVNSANGT
jgi:hypothetical protein